jgi:DNA-binding PadR family transcriptional regulator
MSSPALSLTEWAVLGALATRESHGFGAARALARDGELGRVWTVSRPLVYRAVSTLSAAGLITEAGTAPGAAGPRRRLLSVTPAGRRAIAGWLSRPVEHVRDYRSELMLKLLFLDDEPERRRQFLATQREALAPMVVGLERQLAEAEGFDRVLARWRLDNARAAEGFLEELDAEAEGAVSR